MRYLIMRVYPTQFPHGFLQIHFSVNGLDVFFFVQFFFSLSFFFPFLFRYFSLNVVTAVGHHWLNASLRSWSPGIVIVLPRVVVKFFEQVFESLLGWVAFVWTHSCVFWSFGIVIVLPGVIICFEEDFVDCIFLGSHFIIAPTYALACRWIHHPSSIKVKCLLWFKIF